MLRYLVGILCLFLTIGTVGATDHKELVVYSGRSKGLIHPSSSSLRRRPASRSRCATATPRNLQSLCWRKGRKAPPICSGRRMQAHSARLVNTGYFKHLPESVLSKVPAKFRNADSTWTATSGRARVLAYAPERVKVEELPKRRLRSDRCEMARTCRLGTTERLISSFRNSDAGP